MSKICIFGAGIMGQAIYALLKKDNTVVCFLDNKAADGGMFDGVKIVHPSVLNITTVDKIYIAITNTNAIHEIKEQLIKLNISPEKIRSYKEVLLWQARVEFLNEYTKIIVPAVEDASVAEVGVFQAEFAKEINKAFPLSKLYLFDTFEGFCGKDTEKEDVSTEAAIDMFHTEFQETSVELVLSKMPNPENCIIKKGYFPDTFDIQNEKFCFVSLDTDLYSPIKNGLEIFYPLMIKGAVILVHDYFNDMLPGVKKAVDEFIDEANAVFMPIGDAMSVVIIKV